MRTLIALTDPDAQLHEEACSALGAPIYPGELPCHTSDPDLFFAERPEQLEQAKTLCGSCPVREKCLADALSRGEPWGVWGGEIIDHGVIIARKRPRGRPRKIAA